MPTQLLVEYLQRSHAKYKTISHSAAYTAPEVAETSHIHGDNFAKVVMVRIDRELAMVVLPAHHQVDLEHLATAIGAESVELATEKEFKHRFPRCETGSMPPFGHLYGLDTYMMPVFDPFEEIAFSAGSHTEVMQMPYSEFIRLAHVNEVDDGVVPQLYTPPKVQRRRPRMRL